MGTIKLLRAFRHSQFHSYQSTGLTRERTKMTISCDIPTQMIVDDSSSSSSSPEQTNNLAEVMKARRRKKKKRSPMVGNTFTDLYKLTGQSLGEGSYGKVENCVNVFTGIEYAVKIIEKVPGFFNRSKKSLLHRGRGEQNCSRPCWSCGAPSQTGNRAQGPKAGQRAVCDRQLHRADQALRLRPLLGPDQHRHHHHPHPAQSRG